MPTASLIVQSPFRVVETTLGPGAAKYRDGFKLRMEHRQRINESLSLFDDAVNALEGTPAEIEAKTKQILSDREAAYQATLAKNPPPPNPNDDPSITDEDKRLYTLLEQTILAQAETDLLHMKSAMASFQSLSEGLLDGYIAQIDLEVKKKEKADARVERKNRRVTHRAKVAGTIGQMVGGILQAIPLAVTQVVGAAISIGSAIAQTAVEIDSARRLAYALRDNANWLVYQEPLLLDEIDQEEWNLDYLAALAPLSDSLRDGAKLRMQINDEKLKAGIYDEEALAASRKGVKAVWKVVFYAGLAYAAWRIVFK